MSSFKKSKWMKIITFILLFTFASQSTAWPEVVDLRKQGKLKVTDIGLAIAMGAAMGRMTAPGKGAWDTFARIYLIPAAVGRGIRAVGIKNRVLSAIMTSVLSQGINKGLGFKEAVKETSEQVAAGIVTELTKETTKDIAKETAKASAKSVMIDAFKSTAKAFDPRSMLAGFTKQGVVKEMFKGAVEGLAYSVAYEAIYAAAKKINPQIAQFIATGAAMIASHYAGTAMSKKYAQAASDKDAQEVEKTKEEVSKDPNLTAEQKQQMLADLDIKLGLIQSGMQSAKDALKTRLAMDTRAFWKEMLIAKSAEAITTVAGMKSQTLREELEILSAGLTGLLKNVLYARRTPEEIQQIEDERQADLQNSYEIRVARDSKNVAEIEGRIGRERTQALKDKGVINADGTVNSAKAADLEAAYDMLAKNKEHRIKMARMTAAAAVFEGMKIGAISLGLSKISSKTLSPMHGAYFNLLGSSIVRSMLISGENVKSLPEDIDPATMDDAALSKMVKRGKGFSFYLDMYGASHTAAMADFLSFGRASPIQTSDEYGTATFDLVMQRPSTDAFFIGRYYAYIKEVGDENIGLDAAITSRLVSSVHSQAVSNVKDVVDHTLYLMGADKTSPLNVIYVQKQRGNVSQFARAIRAAQGISKELGIEKGKGRLTSWFPHVLRGQAVEGINRIEQLKDLKQEDAELAAQVVKGERKLDSLSESEIKRLEALGGLEVEREDGKIAIKDGKMQVRENQNRLNRLSKDALVTDKQALEGIRAKDRDQIRILKEFQAVSDATMHRIAPVARWAILEGSYDRAQLTRLGSTVEEAREAKLAAAGPGLAKAAIGGQAQFVEQYTDLFGNREIYSNWEVPMPEITVPQVRISKMAPSIPTNVVAEAQFPLGYDKLTDKQEASFMDEMSAAVDRAGATGERTLTVIVGADYRGPGALNEKLIAGRIAYMQKLAAKLAVEKGLSPDSIKVVASGKIATEKLSYADLTGIAQQRAGYMAPLPQLAVDENLKPVAGKTVTVNLNLEPDVIEWTPTTSGTKALMSQAYEMQKKYYPNAVVGLNIPKQLREYLKATGQAASPDKIKAGTTYKLPVEAARKFKVTTQ